MKLCFVLSGCEVLIYMIISVKIKEKMTKFSCVFGDCSVLIYLFTFVRSSKTLSNIKANSRRGLTSIVVEARRLRFTTFVPFHDIFLLFLSNI
ncbi:hypothetical protein HanPI659440_Chr07g0268921 [Helianthus annuus]|uniref:Uncharacterized protein n=1 Tax=Helianthus annuus TaxID=4232 RepID=A0A9K3NJA4_HELAN|nr:hypothetical protein HanXRQr2_Chr06g0257881 [Helianthus annuus]KAJ0700931.1 hypothetical protein HanOQP8_Chr10g0373631 [Helianthus annuus]KAJ0771419.1 hypothetical protein HanPI659440_Chr07g0268921 [Helianthus annuus]